MLEVWLSTEFILGYFTFSFMYYDLCQLNVRRFLSLIVILLSHLQIGCKKLPRVIRKNDFLLSTKRSSNYELWISNRHVSWLHSFKNHRLSLWCDIWENIYIQNSILDNSKAIFQNYLKLYTIKLYFPFILSPIYTIFSQVCNLTIAHISYLNIWPVRLY